MLKPDGRKLPPMKTLLGFEAVARNLSFRQAAEELHLSHQAVSQQIALLEASLGQALFLRNNRQVSLTPAGKTFYDYIANMLIDLTNECENIRQLDESPCLKVHTYVTVALRWLVPKLPDFRTQNPDIDVQLVSTIRGDEFEEHSADIGLVFKPQKLSSHLCWTHLLTPSFYPVCHPDLLAGRTSLNDMELTQLPLINITSERMQWQDWFDHYQINHVNINLVTVNSTAVALEMASSGEGVALIYDPVVERDLQSARLVRPVAHEINNFTPWGLVYPKDKANWLPIQRFTKWMHEQVKHYQ